ncbi:MAG: FtsX-like permease family protein [Phenylobacterium sp.]|uniref:ABC transporter permease n=1 Tax=Phenylobacterium sp. TaxID=1871053 RepID=UPI0027340E06|nr:FtsX-like permease family protein [Phenylobacterium sp.]MDP1642840.1 FtsX-like permease family protein [Phenylobacterium sp.]MDP3116389.1 FtsX-like permease family protein [Phenylobacterium sp.]
MRLALRFAGRELRSGVAGFRIFLACLALGVAAIAAAGSTAEAFRQGLASQAREILGGDVVFSIDQRRFTEAERAVFEALGPSAYSVRANAMAETPTGARRLVHVRGVADTYPLVGVVQLNGAASLAAALAPAGGVPGAAVEQALLDRLDLNLGDTFAVGDQTLRVGAVLISEPDRIGRGFALGPRVLTDVTTVEAAGLLGAGGLFGEAVRVVLPAEADPKAVIEEVRETFPDAVLEARDRSEAAAGAGRLIDQLEYFLGFIGLASLVAGGLGVGGAVSSYLEGRKASIATLKALGASGVLIRDIYLIQIGVLALLGVGIGLAIGAVTPLIIGALAAEQLPVPALFAVYPEPLVRAAAFGVLAAAAFSLWPLARARTTPPSSLFRKEMSGRPTLSLETALAVAAALGLAGLAILTAPSRWAAAGLIGGAAGAFLALSLLGLAAAWGAGRVRRFARGSVRLGLANLAGPRSAARTATPAIGLGVALLSAIVLIQSSLLAQVSVVAPRTAPSLVFTEIPGERVAAFDAVIDRALNDPGMDRYNRLPLITGRITRLKGQPVDIEAIDRGERWAFDEDLTLSALDGAPEASKVTAGAWWTPGYAGPPLVAFEQDAARGAGLKVGDMITLQVLGREIDAEIAVLREVDWGGFGANFGVILNTGAIAGASPRHVAIAMASRDEEAAVTGALAADFAGVNVISIRDQLEQAATLFDRLALAIRGAAAVAGAAGVLVLIGAIAAGARFRAREAATLKVLGGTRSQIVSAYLVEYGLVGVIAGLAGASLGAAGAWPVVTQVFNATWSVDWPVILGILGGTTALGALGGALAAFAALSRRPAAVLREAG